MTTPAPADIDPRRHHRMQLELASPAALKVIAHREAAAELEQTAQRTAMQSMFSSNAKPAIADRFVDCSSNNGIPNLSAYAAAGHKVIVFKATEGTGYEWLEARSYHAQAHSHGLAVGRYGWPRPDAGPAKAQAEYFVKAIEKTFRPDLGDFAFNDFERSMNYQTGQAVPEPSDAQWAEFYETWMETVEHELGVAIHTYTGNWYVGGRPQVIAAVKRRLVIISEYDDNAAPANPYGFKIMAWQDTDSASVAGFPSRVDYNRRWTSWPGSTTTKPGKPGKPATEEDLMSPENKAEIQKMIKASEKRTTTQLWNALRAVLLGGTYGKASPKSRPALIRGASQGVLDRLHRLEEKDTGAK